MQTARIDIPGIDYDRLVAGGYRKTGIVAMIDALGISSADIRLAEKFIAATYLGLRQTNQLIKKAQELFSANDIQVKEPSVLIIQDTLIFEWEVPPGQSDLIEIVASHMSCAFVAGLTTRFLFRGAISYGEYVHVDDAILGPAVSDAHALGEKADWAGILVTPTAAKHLPEGFEPFSGQPFPFLVSYDVKAKGGESLAGVPVLCAAWPHYFRSEWEGLRGAERDKVKAAFANLLSEFPRNQCHENKYKNTADFFSHCIDSARFW